MRTEKYSQKLEICADNESYRSRNIYLFSGVRSLVSNRKLLVAEELAGVTIFDPVLLCRVETYC